MPFQVLAQGSGFGMRNHHDPFQESSRVLESLERSKLMII